MSSRCLAPAGVALCLALLLVDGPAAAQALSWSPGAYAHVEQFRVAAVADDARGLVHLVMDGDVETDASELALLVPATRVSSWGSVAAGTMQRLAGLLGPEESIEAAPPRTRLETGVGERLPPDDESRRRWFVSRRLALTPQLESWLRRRDDAGQAVIAYTFAPAGQKQDDQKKSLRRRVSVGPLRVSYEGPLDSLLHARAAEDVPSRARYLLRHRVSEAERQKLTTRTTAWLFGGRPWMLEGTDNPAGGIVRGPRVSLVPNALAGAIVETAGWSFDPRETALWHASGYSWDDSRVPPLADIRVLAVAPPRSAGAASTPSAPRVMVMPAPPNRTQARARRPWKPSVPLVAAGLALATALVTVLLDGRRRRLPGDSRKPT